MSPTERDRLRAVLELLEEGVSVWDAEGRLLMANPAFFRICRMDPSVPARLDAPGWQAVYEDGRPIPDEEWPARAALREGRAIVGMRLGMVHPDGGLTWLSVNATPLPDGDPGPEVIISFTEVTAEHQAREALRADRAMLTALIDGIADAVVLRDGQGRYLAVNKTFTSWARRPREEIIGRTPEEVLPPMWHGAARAGMETMRADPVPRTMEAEDPTSGRTWRVTRTPWLDEEGTLRGVVLIASEVTEYRRLQREMSRTNAELEARVRARTRDLERAVAELEAFTTRVSHDLRAPLRAIQGLVRGLVPSADPPVAEDLRRVEEAAGSLAALVDALLELSRAGRNAVSPERIPVDMGRLAGEVAAGLAEEAAARGVTVRVGPMPEWPVDLVLMRQVFANLMGNAVKFSRPEGGSVSVTGGVRSGELVVTVADDGVGFPADAPGVLFRAFERLPNATGLEGAGIGLAIVQRIVTAHGGRVWAEGAPDEGARFTFALPRPLDP